jgi:hypothetical protein
VDCGRQAGRHVDCGRQAGQLLAAYHENLPALKLHHVILK